MTATRRRQDRQGTSIHRLDHRTGFRPTLYLTLAWRSASILAEMFARVCIPAPVPVPVLLSVPVPGRFVTLFFFLSLSLVTLASPAPALAQSAGPDALPSVLRVPLALPDPRRVTLAASGGYGFTEGIVDGTDSHHRLSGGLAIAVSPIPVLSFGLRFDGRYDSHAGSQGADDGLVGDPRVTIRGATRVLPWLGLGLQAGLWLPSGNAPSFSLAAATPEINGLVTLAPTRVPVAVSMQIGYRFDRSAASAPDAARLSAADRASLGVNEAGAMLLGVGGTVRTGRVEWLAEWTWDLLVGDRAPAVGASPMHVRAGARIQPMPERALTVTFGIDVSPSARPSLAVGAPLVEIPPRLGVFAVVTVGFPFAPVPPIPSVVLARSAAATTNAASSTGPAAPVAAPGAIAGRVVDEHGTPIAGTRVVVSGPRQLEREVVCDAEGRYSIEHLPIGTYHLTVSSDRRSDLHQTVAVTGSGPVRQDVSMEPPLPAGQLRGTVHAFSGEAVAGTVSIEQLHISRRLGPTGEFEIDVAPGHYTVVIASPGYREQRRRVDVGLNGVTVLNVDLQRAR